MTSILKMKSILSPKISSFSPHFPKFQTFSLPSNARPFESFLWHNPTCISNNLPLKSTPFLSNSFVCYSQSQMEAFPRTPSSGEIHVIVGPMFAGKTTSLLQRMQSESRSGRSTSWSYLLLYFLITSCVLSWRVELFF